MAKTIVGLFDTFEEAQSVVQDLVNSGFDRNQISLVANDADSRYGRQYGGTSGSKDTVMTERDKQETAEAAGSGAVAGSVVGGTLGLLVGIGALAIPGI